ncbi:MAG: winged helix-turn-helix domain-containing protein [Rhizomicrobium sp.]
MTYKSCPTCGCDYEEFEGLRFEDDGRTVYILGKQLRLPGQPFIILREIASAKGRKVSRLKLFEAMYPNEADQDARDWQHVSVKISKLRRAARPLGLDIKNVWGAAYRLEWMA